MRELWEETGAVNADYLAKPTGSVTISAIRRSFVPPAGQIPRPAQKWFALRFTGSDDEIDPLTRATPAGEFDQWRWERLDRVADLVFRSGAKCMER